MSSSTTTPDTTPLAIAICGESGAGKTTTTGLIQKLGFNPCSVSALLREEAESAHDQPTRAQVQEYGRQRQEAEGADYFARRLLRDIDPFHQPRTVIDGLRNLSELSTLRQAAREAGARFVLLAMVTPDATRFERVRSRGRAGDPDTLEEFQAADTRAAGISEGDRAFQQNAALIDHADIRITNDQGMDALQSRIQQLVNELVLL
ncbi:MAG: AAA family ATPase [Pseudohongiella sp.]|uniref:AAA family ATPase n=1 Tax=Pseudohongiella sp. TaxID=1979412 RepID=UPI0034A02EFC